MTTENLKSAQELQAEIAELQKRMAAQLKTEKPAVLSRIREAIPVYGITKEELFPEARVGKKAPGKTGKAGKVTTPPKRVGKRKRREFSFEKKLELLAKHEELMKAGKSHWAAAQAIGVADGIIKNWRKQYGAPTTAPAPKQKTA